MAAGFTFEGRPRRVRVPSERDASEWTSPSAFAWMSRLTNDVFALGAAPNEARVIVPRLAPSFDWSVAVEGCACCCRELPHACPSFWLRPTIGHGVPAIRA